MKKLVYLVMIFFSVLIFSCLNENVDTELEPLTDNEIMIGLNIENPSIWNTLATQSINVNKEVGNETKSAQTATEYPSSDKYYFTLFEDVPSTEADYDFNDIMIRSKLYLESEGDKQTGYLESELWNVGGVVQAEIGVMFYEVNGKVYKNIPYDEIKVNGIQLRNKPWTTNLTELIDNKEWIINFEFDKKSNIWISYFVYSKYKDSGEVWDVDYGYVMQGGFASPEVSEFEVPDQSFLSPTNLCWGMEIEAEDIRVPNEKELFLNCFPDFQEWAESGGKKKTDWFTNPDKAYTSLKETESEQ